MSTLRNTEAETGSFDAYAEGVEFRGVSIPYLSLHQPPHCIQLFFHQYLG